MDSERNYYDNFRVEHAKFFGVYFMLACVNFKLCFKKLYCLLYLSKLTESLCCWAIHCIYESKLQKKTKY